MLRIHCLESTATKPTELFSRFIIGPLSKGQGITIGNALRRTLLSNTPGIAVSGARISGTNHEFSTIKGLREDIIDVLLNLKQLVFKGNFSDPIVARLNFQGPGIINAGHIDLNNNLELVDPKQYIATVEGKTSLEMELIIKKGEGYQLSDKSALTMPSGFLSLDAIFMPVKKVNFFIEVAQDAQSNEQESLILEVQTNGSVTPTKALSKAAMTLEALFEPFKNINTNTETAVEEESRDIQELELENTMIEELELSVRAYNCLKRANISTLGDLLKYSQEELLEFKNFGKKSADEVCENLYKHFNLTLT
uniref:RNA polymerase alpha subunit n=1 Tax=Chrysotila carterae TaxID=13221 RepID=UPI0022F2E491|nr:RNA polymerase alpha subunit [Chrysotila carterae]WAK83173.1 RNA polymerase alpha subunit [Chrysotila carterae]